MTQNLLFADFSQELLHKRMTPLSEEQFNLLLQRMGSPWISDRIAKLQQDDQDAIESVEKWSALARLTTGLNLLQIPIDMGGAVQLLRQHGRERVMSLMSNARKDQDPSHKNELRRMVNAVLDQLETGTGQAPAPEQPAEVSRQTAPLAPGTMGQSRRLGQMPPPPGTQTRRAYAQGDGGPPQDRGQESRHTNDQPQHQAPPGARNNEQPPQRPPPPQSAPAGNNVHALDQGRRNHAARDVDDQGPLEGVTDDAGDGQRTYDTASAFNRGNKGCAVRFQNAQDTRKSDRVRHVVFVESAAINQQTRTTYLWDSKITLMLNEAETEQALMVMYGMLPSVRFTAHGKDKKGWMQIAQQDPNDRYAGCIQVQMGRGGGTLTTNIYPTQLTKIKAVVLRAYVNMMGFDSMDAALCSLRMSASSYALHAAMNQPKDAPQQRRAYAN